MVNLCNSHLEWLCCNVGSFDYLAIDLQANIIITDISTSVCFTHRRALKVRGSQTAENAKPPCNIQARLRSRTTTKLSYFRDETADVVSKLTMCGGKGLQCHAI